MPLEWIPKYRKKILTGEVALRVRDLIRQIAMEHEITILSGKVASDHIHVLVAYRPQGEVSMIVPWRKGIGDTSVSGIGAAIPRLKVVE